MIYPFFISVRDSKGCTLEHTTLCTDYMVAQEVFNEKKADYEKKGDAHILMCEMNFTKASDGVYEPAHEVIEELVVPKKKKRGKASVCENSEKRCGRSL